MKGRAMFSRLFDACENEDEVADLERIAVKAGVLYVCVGCQTINDGDNDCCLDCGYDRRNPLEEE